MSLLAIYRDCMRKRLEVNLAGLEVRLSALEQLANDVETSSHYMDEYLDALDERAQIKKRLEQLSCK